MSDFIFCPDCEWDALEQTDYDDEDGKEDTNGRRCLICGWEGDVSELVCEA